MSEDPLPLVVFCLCFISMFICLLRDVYIPVPLWLSGSRRIPIDFTLPPLIGVIILLIGRTLSFHNLLEGGIIGDDKIQPYAIILLFFSLAFICISFDATGCLTYVAILVAQSAGSSSRKLFINLIILSSIVTALTNNDITILCLTPVVIQCCKVSKLPPWAFLYAVYYAANTFSLIFSIGNPTNVLIAGAFKHNFVQYLMIMGAPALFCVIISGICLYIYYHKDLQLRFIPPSFSARAQLQDVRGAIVHMTILGLAVIIMILGIVIPNMEMWHVAVAGAGLSALYNIFAYPWTTEEAEFEELAMGGRAIGRRVLPYAISLYRAPRIAPRPQPRIVLPEEAPRATGNDNAPRVRFGNTRIMSHLMLPEGTGEDDITLDVLSPLKEAETDTNDVRILIEPEDTTETKDAAQSPLNTEAESQETKRMPLKLMGRSMSYAPGSRMQDAAFGDEEFYERRKFADQVQENGANDVANRSIEPLQRDAKDKHTSYNGDVHDRESNVKAELVSEPLSASTLTSPDVAKISPHYTVDKDSTSPTDAISPAPGQAKPDSFRRSKLQHRSLSFTTSSDPKAADRKKRRGSKHAQRESDAADDTTTQREAQQQTGEDTPPAPQLERLRSLTRRTMGGLIRRLNEPSLKPLEAPRELSTPAIIRAAREPTGQAPSSIQEGEEGTTRNLGSILDQDKPFIGTHFVVRGRAGSSSRVQVPLALPSETRVQAADQEVKVGGFLAPSAGVAPRPGPVTPAHAPLVFVIFANRFYEHTVVLHQIPRRASTAGLIYAATPYLPGPALTTPLTTIPSSRVQTASGESSVFTFPSPTNSGGTTSNVVTPANNMQSVLVSLRIASIYEAKPECIGERSRYCTKQGQRAIYDGNEDAYEYPESAESNLPAPQPSPMIEDIDRSPYMRGPDLLFQPHFVVLSQGASATKVMSSSITTQLDSVPNGANGQSLTSASASTSAVEASPESTDGGFSYRKLPPGAVMKPYDTSSTVQHVFPIVESASTAVWTRRSFLFNTVVDTIRAPLGEKITKYRLEILADGLTNRDAELLETSEPVDTQSEDEAEYIIVSVVPLEPDVLERWADYEAEYGGEEEEDENEEYDDEEPYDEDIVDEGDYEEAEAKGPDSTQDADQSDAELRLNRHGVGLRGVAAMQTVHEDENEGEEVVLSGGVYGSHQLDDYDDLLFGTSATTTTTAPNPPPATSTSSSTSTSQPTTQTPAPSVGTLPAQDQNSSIQTPPRSSDAESAQTGVASADSARSAEPLLSPARSGSGGLEPSIAAGSGMSNSNERVVIHFGPDKPEPLVNQGSQPTHPIHVAPAEVRTKPRADSLRVPVAPNRTRRASSHTANSNRPGRVRTTSGAGFGAEPEDDLHSVILSVKPTNKAIMSAMPWKLIPFLFSMFCLVEGLRLGGWVELLSKGLISGMGGVTSINKSNGIGPALFLSVFTVIVCNIMNNQAANVLLTRIVTSNAFSQLNTGMLHNLGYAVVVGGNVAALLTIIGALGGTLFTNLLVFYKQEMNYLKFARVGCVLTPFILVLTTLVTIPFAM